MLWWALVMQLSLNHVCFCKYPLTRIPVRNPSKTYWFTMLGFGGIHNLVLLWALYLR